MEHSIRIFTSEKSIELRRLAIGIKLLLFIDIGFTRTYYIRT